MLYHLFEALKDYDIPGQGLMGYLSFRAMLANVISMLFAFFAGAPIIRWLQRQQIGETMTFDELREAQTAVLAAFMDCIWPGKTRKADDGTEPDEGDAAKKPMPQRTMP